ncbi:T9SS type A sorting domain-containing protein [Flavobacterium faecale]|uniref:pectate lyase family protein n=1 Tax=Flavobacterium faecale TaxID=1355330 RepID=UPI003AADB904
MKKIVLYLTLIFASIQGWAQSVNITESGGWLETAYVKWEPVSGATSYNVYYTGNGITNQKIDNPLIRSYGSYFRADIPGIAAGNYALTVKPVIAGTEEAGTTTGTIAVSAHDRTGFSFSNGRVPGAYKADGTPKANAVILYVTESTKNSISLTVTGANANPCVGLQTILDGFKKGKDLRPLIVRMIGNITDFSYMLGGDIVIENANNAASYITLEGIGNDAVANGWGIRIKNASNIEVRNLGTMNCNSSEGDNIGLQQSNDYIWVHNCDLFYGHAGSANDQAKGDGALDSKKSNYVTFSYNHFWDSGKCNLLGLSEGAEPGYITYHHNWYDHSDSRHPRVRYYSVHIYNNYFDGNSKYGSGSTLGSDLFIEANYYRNAKNPMMTSMQGTDVWSSSKQANDPSNQGTFSGEDGGSIKAFNNFFDADIATNSMRFVAYGDPNPLYNIAGKIDSTIDFDAYVVTSRNEQVPLTVKSFKGANTYNNFDTNATIMYSYTPDSPLDAKNKTMQLAGRMQGGDLKWTFNNTVDDTSDAVLPALKAALTGYATKIVYIQGEAQPSTQTLVVTTANSNQDVVQGEALETIVFTWGGDATDVNVTGLPASGINFIKNPTDKTLTISGSPTANISYTVTTTGTTGTTSTQSGTITVVPPGTNTGGEIHNFTDSLKTSTFYAISGNMNSTDGTQSYDGLTLTKRLKIESATRITYTSTATSTLTLVFNSGFSGKIKLTVGTDIAVNTTSYTAVNGIVTIPSIAAGTYTISKGDTTDLYYIKTEYSLGVNDFEKNKALLYPNPVSNVLNIANVENIKTVEIYSLSGALVKTQNNDSNRLELDSLTPGNYLVRVTTTKGVTSKIIIKK